MVAHKCNICAYVCHLAILPEVCPFCGTFPVKWLIATGRVDCCVKFRIRSLHGSFVVYDEIDFDRHICKAFFRDNDDWGNPVYRYFEMDTPMLFFRKAPDGGFVVYAPGTTKNFFLLNGSRIMANKIPLKPGDKLDLFSVERNRVVLNLMLEPYRSNEK